MVWLSVLSDQAVEKREDYERNGSLVIVEESRLLSWILDSGAVWFVETFSEVSPRLPWEFTIPGSDG